MPFLPSKLFYKYPFHSVMYHARIKPSKLLSLAKHSHSLLSVNLFSFTLSPHKMEAKNVNSTITAPENPKVTTVRHLYEALASGNRKISNIAGDLEWWFHGPQNCHYMMKMLTGKSSPSDYRRHRRRVRNSGGLGGRSSVLGARVDPKRWCNHSVQRIFQHLVDSEGFEEAYC